jgi:hypothetical protein
MLWALGHEVLDCSATFTAVWASIPLKKISGSHFSCLGGLSFSSFASGTQVGKGWHGSIRRLNSQVICS